MFRVDLAVSVRLPRRACIQDGLIDGSSPREGRRQLVHQRLCILETSLAPGLLEPSCQFEQFIRTNRAGDALYGVSHALDLVCVARFGGHAQARETPIRLIQECAYDSRDRIRLPWRLQPSQLDQPSDVHRGFASVWHSKFYADRCFPPPAEWERGRRPLPGVPGGPVPLAGWTQQLSTGTLCFPLTQAATVAEVYVAENLGWRTTNALRLDLTRAWPTIKTSGADDYVLLRHDYVMHRCVVRPYARSRACRAAIVVGRTEPGVPG
jgi:hypothetical protein